MDANTPGRWHQFSLREFFTKRRRFRFSLRTLLILVTVLATGLGYISFRTRNQTVAVARINQLGGTFQYDDKLGSHSRFNPTRWPWLRSFVGDEYLLDVVFVKLDGTKVTDADLRVIGKLGRTKILFLNGTDISDDGLASIRGMSELNHLELKNTKVTSKGIRYLRPPQIVMLEDTEVGPDALPSLSGCARLGLDGTQITSEDLKQLTGYNNLRELSIQRTVVTDEAVPILAKFSTLQLLNVNDTKISGEGLFALRKALPKCRLASGCADIAGDDRLSRFPENIRGETFISISKQLNKRHPVKLLILSSPLIADAHLSMVQGFDSLEVLDLRGARVTDEGVRKLQETSPKLKIYR